jgi:AraC-like DNA-binding protein
LCAEQTPRTWTVFNPTYALTVLRSWKGRVDYRRRRVQAGPGEVFCSEPGEVHTAVPVEGVGSFKVLMLDKAVFDEQCHLEGFGPSPHFRAIIAKATPRLGGALIALHAALEDDATALEVQSRLAVLAQAAIAEVLEPLPRPSTRLPTRDNIQRLRDLLHSGEWARTSLTEFARESGMSQYQLLRGFKRLYGMPPHAYELTMRVERARSMMRNGYTAAQAAAANGFTDQSHFSRHFRRLWGMTPGQYALMTSSSPAAVVGAAVLRVRAP